MVAVSLGVTVMGSPPRVRSRRHDRGPVSGRSGITSACAEQTWMAFFWVLLDGDHLRVCGADVCAAVLSCS